MSLCLIELIEGNIFTLPATAFCFGFVCNGILFSQQNYVFSINMRDYLIWLMNALNGHQTSLFSGSLSRNLLRCVCRTIHTKNINTQLITSLI